MELASACRRNYRRQYTILLSHLRSETLMQRNASAHWSGGLKDGKGTLTSPSGVLKSTPYSFATRFESQPGTNPKELIAAAHAGLTAQSIDTTATVTLEKLDSGFAVTSSHLQVKVKIPGADKAKFEEAAKNAKEGCPISKLLNAKISMDAQLEN